MPSEDNVVGLADERGAEIRRYDPNAPIRSGLPPAKPPAAPGAAAAAPQSRGAAVRGEDNVEGLAYERSRQAVSEALDRANAAMTALGQRFHDPMATGSITKAYPGRNPVPHADQLGLYLRPAGKGYANRVADLAQRAADSPETLGNVHNYLIADAYQRSVRFVTDKKTGLTTRQLDRKALDRWKTDNHEALNAFPEARGALDDADELVTRARALGAEPPPTARAADVQALERFVDDPQRFWTRLRASGENEGRKMVDDLVKAVRSSRDDAAWRGLKHSLWSSQVVEEFTKYGVEVGSPQVTLSGVRRVLGEPQMRYAIEQLFGSRHVEDLERAAKLQDAINASASIPSNVQPTRLLAPREALEQFGTQATLFTSILGRGRRALKVTKAIDQFLTGLSDRQINAITQEAVLNPPLLRELLTANPSTKVVRSIWMRMGANEPTLFPRAQFEKWSREEEARERKVVKPKPPATPINRGVTTTPRLSFERSGDPALGIFR
jgi:hypothetical protein